MSDNDDEDNEATIGRRLLDDKNGHRVPRHKRNSVISSGLPTPWPCTCQVLWRLQWLGQTQQSISGSVWGASIAIVVAVKGGQNTSITEEL
jgi:hypothetical protein